MIEVLQSRAFATWLNNLSDGKARARILARIDRMTDGHLGDVAPIGEGLSEARLHFGPGYRLYFLQRGQVLIVLLCGGDKGSQDRDIRHARRIAAAWKEQHHD
ncbi:type II toxin-antitoxin system RelE/ParE family toxin [Pseudomonas sp. No.21]|uniref:type II toxin-antitoxin system RelE/ParE family toxin n=1 Tax=Pseudomonas tohonis TaxID=2725477 RepID=UPI001F186B4A|nr:type II toxin-antitoxin system RelE/ParE family toxin [Pseudomonas tohonis]GJN47830.1 addiction module antitoxin RelB [Pseudomonas tohonis]